MLTLISVPAAAQAATSIYECRASGRPVFSDLPCSANAVKREVKITISAGEAPPPVPAPARVSASVTRKPTPKESAKRASPPVVSPCEKLFTEKDRLEARMRTGYGAKEGEQLRAAHHQVTTDLYTRKCTLLK